MVKKWDIFYIDLNPVKGSEQQGKRPVLVISNDAVNMNLPIFTCIPFSSVKPDAKIYPTEVCLSTAESGLPRDSILMLQQIRTVSVNRISGDKIKTITDDTIKEKINQAIRAYFDLD